MADSTKPGPGQIGWVDLTVRDAEAARDFYQDVTGWTPSPVSMGDYQDYCMNAASGRSVAGICHARGVNAGLPPVWMIYIVVADLDEAMSRCQTRGGKVLRPPETMGGGDRFCVIQDPAGATAALFESQSGRA
jgi:predicted enzyme related to lactoylglutathione lyase